MALLRNISPALDGSLPTLLVIKHCNKCAKKTGTDLQVALGVLFKDSKRLLNHLYDYGVSCSYDEVNKLKRSAANVASDDMCCQGISNKESGTVQVIADNYDANIYSPKEKLSTHSLAMIITQPESGCMESSPDTIARIPKHEMAEPILSDQDVDLTDSYAMPAKTPMSTAPCS